MLTTISPESIQNFAHHLKSEERAPGTIESYLRSLRAFAAWLGARALTKDALQEWKAELLAQHFAPVTINAKLAAVHSFLRFSGRSDCRVRYLRLQRRVFREDARALTKNDYQRLLRAAKRSGLRKLALIIENLGATGIRVSELSAITAQALREGCATVHLKGKIRVILLPPKLCEKLRTFARAQKITRGALFCTAGGKPLSRKSIWAQMKRLARIAGVAPSRVFPHNLRHLFARTFYEATGDIARLADVLGHSSIETTRLYLRTPGWECLRQLDRLGLVE